MKAERRALVAAGAVIVAFLGFAVLAHASVPRPPDAAPIVGAQPPRTYGALVAVPGKPESQSLLRFEDLLGRWKRSDKGMELVGAAPQTQMPVSMIVLAGQPSGTVTISGTPVDGWAAAFGVTGADTYWMVSVRRGPDRVQLIQVARGRATDISSSPASFGENVEVALRITGRTVEASVGSVVFPAQQLPDRPAAVRVGLAASGAAARPGAAAWTSIEVVPGTPLAPPLEVAGADDLPISRTAAEYLLDTPDRPTHGG